MTVKEQYRVSFYGNSIVLEYVLNDLVNIQIVDVCTKAIMQAMISEVILDKQHLLEHYKHLGYEVEQLKLDNTAQKIALWCYMYKQRFAIDYKVTKQEAGLCKDIEISSNLIATFFDANEWWSREKTLSRYGKYINEVKRIASAGSSTQSGKHRSDLAKEFERRYKD